MKWNKNRIQFDTSNSPKKRKKPKNEPAYFVTLNHKWTNFLWSEELREWRMKWKADTQWVITLTLLAWLRTSQFHRWGKQTLAAPRRLIITCGPPRLLSTACLRSVTRRQTTAHGGTSRRRARPNWRSLRTFRSFTWTRWLIDRRAQSTKRVRKSLSRS